MVEDEADIRSLMVMHLQRENYQVTAIENGEKALQQLNADKYDLVVLDWMLPGLSGLEICKMISGKTPILMVTARSNASDIVLGLEMGADDYVTKPFEISIFIARVRSLLRRHDHSNSSANNEQFIQIDQLKINTNTHKAWNQNEELKLTASEFKLLTALLKSKGKVLSRDKLIAVVQGSDVNVTDRTIDTHIFELRKKLGKSAEVIETIRGVGYRIKFE